MKEKDIGKEAPTEVDREVQGVETKVKKETHQKVAVEQREADCNSESESREEAREGRRPGGELEIVE